ncbi:MAG: hypothetical protein RL240_4179 [Planctomycetota bacterium]|jgi:hypothetical protein
MSSTASLILIANCTATKRVSAGDALMLRKWTGTIRQRFAWWTKAIDAAGFLTPARYCYAGDAWAQVLAAESVKPECTLLWVVSAGLGLISVDQPIPNYSATFINSDSDSIGHSKNQNIDWWNLCVEWQRKKTGVGSIADLATANPDAKFVVALSTSYLAVVKNDLILARESLSSPDNLLVISAGTRHLPDLHGSLMPIDARFENLVGGARATLNARMLRHIIEKFKPEQISASMVESYLNNIATSLKQARSYDRKILNDKQIAAFIRKHSRKNSRTSASSLLRLLRDEGSACEQKRFQRIYRSIQPE